MANKLKKKPTIRELSNAVIEINNRVNECYGFLRDLDNIVGLYIAMKGDVKEFNEYIKKTVEEKKKEMEENNDAKGDENSDRIHIPANTDNEGSGAEGIRTEGK